MRNMVNGQFAHESAALNICRSREVDSFVVLKINKYLVPDSSLKMLQTAITQIYLVAFVR